MHLWHATLKDNANISYLCKIISKYLISIAYLLYSYVATRQTWLHVHNTTTQGRQNHGVQGDHPTLLKTVDFVLLSSHPTFNTPLAELASTYNMYNAQKSHLVIIKKPSKYMQQSYSWNKKLLILKRSRNLSNKKLWNKLCVVIANGITCP